MIPPRKLKNSVRRVREHLTPAEIDKLMAAARQVGRHGLRDATMILIAYRGVLRSPSKVPDLKLVNKNHQL